MILFKLRQIKLSRNLYNLVADYFRDREAQLSVASTLIKKRITRGCPQGSSLSPTLWNVLYDDFIRLKKGEDVTTIAFADDCILLFGGNSRRELETKSESILKIVLDWGHQHKLNFNPRKSQCIVFTPPRSKSDLYRRTPVIKMGNQSIPVVKNFKYLGVILDHKLTWKDHVLMIKKKITRIFNALSAISRVTWGLTHQSLKLVYNAVFVPVVTYACHVWGHRIDTAYMRKILIGAQRAAALRITKSYWTISTDALCVLAGITPVCLLVLHKMEHFSIRTGGDVRFGDMFFAEGSYETKGKPFMMDEPWIRRGLNSFVENHIYDFCIYTDGSKTSSGVGSAFIVYDSNGHEIHQFQGKLHPRCSIFQAELFAVLESVKWCIVNCAHGKTLLNCDSKSVVSVLKSANGTHPFSVQIRSLISSNDLTDSIHIRWVKAHSGVAGNERADQLAKSAASSDMISMFDIIPSSAIKKELSDHITSLWQEEWNRSRKGRLTFQFFPQVNDCMRIGINVDFYSSQLLSGHGKLRKYLHMLHLADSALCLRCGGEETVQHIIFECERFSTERLPLETQVRRFGITWPCPLRLFMSCPELAEELLHFFRTVYNSL